MVLTIQDAHGVRQDVHLIAQFTLLLSGGVIPGFAGRSFM